MGIVRWIDVMEMTCELSPEKQAEMQTKLRGGLQILATASQDDTRSLNDALLKIYRALEDVVCREMEAKAQF